MSKINFLSKKKDNVLDFVLKVLIKNKLETEKIESFRMYRNEISKNFSFYLARHKIRKMKLF